MFKGIGNIASLMRQAPLMMGKMQAINDQLKARRAVANSGAGLVEVEVNGLGEVLRVKLDPTLSDREMMEDLLVAALNQAQQKSNELRAEAMQAMAQEMDIPGLAQAMAQFSGEEDKS